MKNAAQAESYVLGAVGGTVLAGTPPTRAIVRARTPLLTDQEFDTAFRRLIASGAIIRTGNGYLTRKTSAWQK